MEVTKILSIKRPNIHTHRVVCGLDLDPRKEGRKEGRKEMATGLVSSPNHPATCYWRSQRCSAGVVVCKGKAKAKSGVGVGVTKRGLAISLGLGLGLSSIQKKKISWDEAAYAAILEADDDLELLEKVKKDRKKRLERQEVISSSNKEASYVQELVYKLSKVGQAIDNNDLTSATSLLGSTTTISDSDWVKKGNAAFTKLTSNSEEKVEVDAFNSSLASLVSSVAQNDINSSKIAFVSSATALEKWASLTGLAALLKGL